MEKIYVQEPRDKNNLKEDKITYMNTLDHKEWLQQSLNAKPSILLNCLQVYHRLFPKKSWLVARVFHNFMAAENQMMQLTQILTQKLSDNLSMKSMNAKF